MSSRKREGSVLAAGGLAAVLASACCLGPLVLVTVGVSGAWIANLTLLEPYRPIFLGIALLAMYFAWRRLYRLPPDCKPGEVCAAPAVARSYRLLFWLVVALIAVAMLFPFVLPWFY